MSSSEPTPSADDSLASPVRHAVLIVEDHPDVGWLMKNLVTHCGYQAHLAVDAGEALALAREVKPKVVLLDIGLPGMSGYELAGELRSAMAEFQPVLVALTGHSDDEHQRLSREAGFAFHLVKPVSLDRLAHVLQSCTNKAAIGHGP